MGELADAGLVLHIWCNRCGRKRSRDALTLSLLAGRHAPIGRFYLRLWCIECEASGKRVGEVFSMAQLPGIPMGFCRV